MKINRPKYFSDMHDAHKSIARNTKIGSIVIGLVGGTMLISSICDKFEHTTDDGGALVGISLGVLSLVISRLGYEISQDHQDQAAKYKQLLQEFQNRQKQK